jgi:hypothetical protein
MRTVLLALPCLLLAACSGEPAPQASGTATASEAAPQPPAPPPVPVPVPADARAVSESNDLYEFDYAYPAAAASIPSLKALLDKDLDARKAELIRLAREGQRDAKGGGYEYHPYSRTIDWKVVTDLPGWLSMSTIVGDYSGGAHPNYGYEGLLWDRSTNRRYAAEDLFVSKGALSAAIRKPFCAELDRQRARKRGGEAPGLPEFAECIDPVEQTVILGSNHGKAFNRIGVLVAPYAAGPYAEGDYDVTVPVTDAVLRAVKPEYLPLFSTR